ncbi:SafA/ExsA family spore coat assembly protein [Desulfofalx alkaliphila]|uniref:SafA/ExsA family spore coat assembly protein n=1 Tax=Desulfofalx alkaliphila TaxID=105483 RepID=UPI0006901DC5|nr:SafA/ExsA family spore coat assembly protein [Desulfofalx alkaliphila]
MQYTVQAGDTLFRIAQGFGVSLDQLIAANPQIRDPNIIMPGQIINIPVIKDGGPFPDYTHGGHKPGYHHCLHGPDKNIWQKVCLPTPYPEVKVERPNPRYGSMLMDALADKNGEMTAINLYLYYYTILENTKYEELSELLEAISIIEMRHMHDLMKFIKLLGCDPKYENSLGVPWCATYVNYKLHNVCNLLMAVIQDEENAAKLYTCMAREIKDKCVSDWLLRAAEDETHHAKLFKKYYSKYCRPMG